MEDYSKDYLDGKFGAIPIIKHIIDWDEVWQEFESKRSEHDRKRNRWLICLGL